MRFASGFSTFVGLVHLPRIGPTFFTGLSGLKISRHPSPEFLLAQAWLPRFLLTKESFSAMEIIFAVLAGSLIREEFGKKVAILRC